MSILPYNTLINNPIIIYYHSNEFDIPEIKNELNAENKNIRYILPRTISYMFINEINISYNNIVELPVIHSLIKLKCNNCRLMNLENYPKLKYLECANNYLSELPEYKNLTYLDCSNNMISNINHLQSLKKIICSDNPIQSINLKELISLKADNCPIITLHHMPGLSSYSYIYKHGNLECIKNINYEYIIIKNVWRI